MKSHNTKRLILFLKGIPFSFLSLILPRKKRIIFNSTHNENFTFNSKYLFEHFLKEHPEIEIKFVINIASEREKLIQQYGNYFISTHSFQGIFYALKSKIWITSTLETPVGGFGHSFRRTVIHLGHGTPIKNIGLLEKKISFTKRGYYFFAKTNFTYLISSSESLNQIWSNFLGIRKKRVLNLGQPRHDIIRQNNKFPFIR